MRRRRIEGRCCGRPPRPLLATGLVVSLPGTGLSALPGSLPESAMVVAPAVVGGRGGGSGFCDFGGSCSICGVNGRHVAATPEGVRSPGQLAEILELGVDQLDANILRESFEEKLLEEQVVSQEAQHFVHQGRGFGVAQRAEVEEARCSFVFAEAECADEAVLQGRVFVVVRRAADEIQQSGRVLLVEGCDDIVVLRFVG